MFSTFNSKKSAKHSLLKKVVNIEPKEAKNNKSNKKINTNINKTIQNGNINSINNTTHNENNNPVIISKSPSIRFNNTLVSNNLTNNSFANLIPNPESKQIRFVGLSPRSRMGCIECKRKKKRCDESKPACGLCNRTRAKCKLEKAKMNKTVITSEKINGVEDEEEKIKESKLNEKSDKIKEIAMPDFQNGYNSNEIKAANISPKLNSISKVRSSSFSEIKERSNSSSPVTDLIMKYSTNILNKKIPLYYLPKFGNEYSNDKSIIFLEYYCENVAKSFSTVSEDYNYFLKVYLPMASNNESVLYSLIAWGGKFLGDEGSKELLEYNNGNDIQINQNYFKLFSKEREELLHTLACGTICVAIQISTGDIETWDKLFEICKELIEISGGIKSLTYTMEEKWLVSNFSYHDILSSISNENGTIFTTKDYNEIYELNDVIYGIDPLQSCLKPLFLVMGEIINYSIQFKKKIYSKNGKNEERFQFNKELSKNEILDKLTENEIKFKEFENKIKESKPIQSDLQFFKSSKDMEEHLTLFELFQMTLRLFLRQVLKNYSSNNIDIQYLLIRINFLLDFLIGSSVKSALLFPMIMAGINSVDENDRIANLERFDQYWNNNYPRSGNIKLGKIVVEESWNINPIGNLCVNWYEIAKSLNWSLNLA
ncbi:Zn(II)2Cys6 transcription factor ASCRUDRAFT_34726 [Ascoidea rubescens DSM 1968]|uniref:Zn(2)-C6 fungal-type domain-containing protein n=1 Tax=Ascoidea rubescens DSM 1968 TaxID=1344418 RepID=A0A1D2VHJ2_9ASCO|nr:hypothetical protein ASCRUDRAFT_34726 [Ascoidea rubescens DSM 1968]ODV61062.1 hypothetical protein ASCRUDRAFT_34726 [Ascoidea rubescens DSM 1968]